MNAIVVGREGQWRINNEEEKNSNDERGGGGAVAATISAALVLGRVCVRVVWLVAIVAMTAAHPRWPRFLFWIARRYWICAVQVR